MCQMLIVDDEILTIRGLEASLEWTSFGIDRIFSARNMRSAKEILNAEKIDLLFCDIELPQSNGLELVKWMNDEKMETVTVLLTCHAEFEFAKRAIGLGVLEYLLKPVSISQLEKVVEKSIKIIQENRSGQLELNDGQPDHNKELPVIREIKEYIGDNVSGEVSREIIAEVFHFNPDYLSKLFKSETGETLSEYLFGCRMRMAKDMLLNTEMPISDIVTYIGYSNFSHFSKIFKKLTGTTPLKYRKGM